MFQRWNWITLEKFREAFNYTEEKHSDETLLKAIRYGCERVDLECGGAISELLNKRPWPGDLTKDQQDAVEESVGWCANHMIKQGLEWLRGSQSVSLGQISTGQTNPEEPDYFLPFLRKKLVSAGLIKFVYANSVPERREYESFSDWARDTDDKNQIPSLDFLKKAYLMKSGLHSKDGTITIQKEGTYEGVDIGIRDLLMNRIIYKGLTIFEEFVDDLPQYTLEVPPCNGSLPIEKLFEMMKKEVDKLKAETGEKFRKLEDELRKLVDDELELWKELFSEHKKEIKEVIDKFTKDWKEFQDKIKAEWEAWQKEHSNLWSDFKLALEEEWNKFQQDWKEKYDKDWKEHRERWAKWQEEHNELWEKYKQGLEKEIAEWEKQLLAQWEEWKKEHSNLWEEYKKKLEESLEKWKEILRSEWEEWKQKRLEEWEEYKRKLEDEIEKKFGELSEEIKKELSSWLEGKVALIKNEVIEWLLKELEKEKYRRGPRGPQGPEGPRGPQGIRGPSGWNGRDGRDGKNFPTWEGKTTYFLFESSEKAKFRIGRMKIGDYSGYTHWNMVFSDSPRAVDRTKAVFTGLYIQSDWNNKRWDWRTEDVPSHGTPGTFSLVHEDTDSEIEPLFFGYFIVGVTRQLERFRWYELTEEIEENMFIVQGRKVSRPSTSLQVSELLNELGIVEAESNYEKEPKYLSIKIKKNLFKQRTEELQKQNEELKEQLDTLSAKVEMLQLKEID